MLKLINLINKNSKIFSILILLLVVSLIFREPKFLYQSPIISLLLYVVVFCIGIVLFLTKRYSRLKPALSDSQLLAKYSKDHKIQEAETLLKGTDRELGIRFLHEIVKKDNSYASIALLLFSKYLEKFSKGGNSNKEMQLIIDTIFGKEWDFYKNKPNKALEISNCLFTDISFKETKLENVNFNSCTFNNVSFENSSLVRVVYTGSKFTDVSFKEAALDFLEIVESSLTNVNFSSTKGYSEFTNCVIDNITFISSTADLYLEDCQVKNSFFGKAEYIGLDFSEGSIVDTIFDDMECDCLLLTKVSLNNVSFKNAKIVEGDVYEVEFENVNFDNSVIEDTEFSMSDLSKVDFSKAQLDQHSKEQIENCTLNIATP